MVPRSIEYCTWNCYDLRQLVPHYESATLANELVKVTSSCPDHSQFQSATWPKDRMVIDIRCLSKFMPKQKFRTGMITRTHLHLRQEAWLLALDLLDAYWHVPIYLRFHKYLGIPGRG